MTDQQRRSVWLLAFALTCVAATSIFVMVMNWRLTATMSSPDWCARAINAEKLAGTRTASSCVDLLSVQLRSLAVTNYIYAGIIAVCLLVLMVVVVADAQLRLRASKDGIDTEMGRRAEQAAQRTADAAQAEADDIKGGVA